MSGDGSEQKSLVDRIVSGETGRDGVDGILCNDPSGLCMAARGSLNTRNNIANSGVYTNLIRLASQLQGASKNEEQQQQQQQQPQQQQPSGGGVGASTTEVPLITIEYDDSAVLVKEYDGHVVALRVPSAKAAVVTSQGSDTVLNSTGSSSPQNGSISST